MLENLSVQLRDQALQRQEASIAQDSTAGSLPRIPKALVENVGQVGTEEVRMVQDPNKKSRELEKPIRLTVTKSQAVVRYPVTCAQRHVDGLNTCTNITAASC